MSDIKKTLATLLVSLNEAFELTSQKAREHTAMAEENAAAAKKARDQQDAYLKQIHLTEELISTL